MATPRKLEKGGWRIGTVAEFLRLSREEKAFIEMKLALARRLRERRQDKKLTQKQLADRIRSSQSRVAKMEAADPSVSFDFMVKTLLSLGATRREIADTIRSAQRVRAG